MTPDMGHAVLAETPAPPALPKTIDVALGIDANFAPHAAAVIASVVHYAPGASFRFIILHVGVDAAMRKRVESVAPKAAFEWAEVSDTDLPAFASVHHFTRATLFGMGLEKLAPMDAMRVLYLDADIAIARDVRPLWAQDLGGAPIGAVLDPNLDAAEFAKRWNLPGQGRYFNAGILVVDLAKVREGRYFSRAIDFIAEHGAALPLNDQDALNWACWGQWKKLDAVWNVQRAMSINSRKANLAPEKRIDGRKPAIIHFTGWEKPWTLNAYHPWSWIYWQSLARTPFHAEVSAKQGFSRMARLKLISAGCAAGRGWQRCSASLALPSQFPCRFFHTLDGEGIHAVGADDLADQVG